MTKLKNILTEIEQELERAIIKFPTWPDRIIFAGRTLKAVADVYTQQTSGLVNMGGLM